LQYTLTECFFSKRSFQSFGRQIFVQQFITGVDTCDSLISGVDVTGDKLSPVSLLCHRGFIIAGVVVTSDKFIADGILLMKIWDKSLSPVLTTKAIIFRR
jgi:hypothetical protein